MPGSRSAQAPQSTRDAPHGPDDWHQEDLWKASRTGEQSCVKQQGLTQGSEMHSCSWPQTTKSRKRGRKLSFMKSLLLPAWAMRFWCSAKMLYQALWGKSGWDAGRTLRTNEGPEATRRAWCSLASAWCGRSGEELQDLLGYTTHVGTFAEA